MADRVGQRLGSYRLTRLLGRGGFAEVYLAEHQRLQTLAAIKVLHTQLSGEDVGEFLKEAQIIARLDHPHIVRVLDFDVHEGTPFLVMSYAPNGTLRQHHPKGVPLPLSTIVEYVKQVADALQYAHDEKLIHRDIKPENMLLGRRQEILLSDFGIALVAQSSRMQNTQDVVGTAYYMAPEQLQGKPRFASDQYALGIVAYEWISGRVPFQGSFTEIASQHVLTPPPPLRERIPTISPDIEQVMFTALAKDPTKRFGSVRAFANALEQASQSARPYAIATPPLAPTILADATPVITPPVADIPANITLSTNIPSVPQVSPIPVNSQNSNPAEQQTPINTPPIYPPAPPRQPPPPFNWGGIFDIGIVLAMCLILAVGIAPELPEVPESFGGINDVARYQCYALAFWQGPGGIENYAGNGQCNSINSEASAYHALPEEYPLLSLVIFSLGTFTAPLEIYQLSFAVCMAALAALTYYLLKRYRSRKAALAFTLYLVLGCWATAEARFDLSPALLTLVALLLALRSKWQWAFATLAIATLLKLYPAVLILPFLIAQLQQYGRQWRPWQQGLGTFLGICGGGILLSLILSPSGTLNPFLFLIQRPAQAESLPATLIWIGNEFGFPIRGDIHFHSFNFISALSIPVILLGFVAFILGAIYVCLWQRRGQINLPTACLLIIALLLITGKVFSAQYLIWVVPFAAYVGQGRRKWVWSWACVALLTTVIYPYIYQTFSFYNNPLQYYSVIALRNAAFLAIVCVLFYKAAHAHFHPQVVPQQ